MIYRLSAAGTILVAGAAAVYGALGSGVGPLRLARWLAGHDHALYAAWVGWMTLAPVVLLAAAWASRRTPWPWVAATSLHLLALVAGQARLAHLTDAWVWALVAAAVALGLTSVVTAVNGRQRPVTPPGIGADGS